MTDESIERRLARLEREQTRSQDRITSVAAGLLYLALVVAALEFRRMFERSQDIWDWIGTAVLAATVAAILWQAVRRFDAK